MRRLEIKDDIGGSPLDLVFPLVDRNGGGGGTGCEGSVHGHGHGGSALRQRQHCLMAQRQKREAALHPEDELVESEEEIQRRQVYILADLGSTIAPNSTSITARQTASTSAPAARLAVTPTPTPTPAPVAVPVATPISRDSSDQARISSVRSSKRAAALSSVRSVTSSERRAAAVASSSLSSEAAAQSLASLASSIVASVASVQSSMSSASAAQFTLTADPSLLSLISSVDGLFSTAESLVSSRIAAASSAAAATSSLSASSSTSLSTSSASPTTASPTSSLGTSTSTTSSAASAAATIAPPGHTLNKKYIPAIVVPIVAVLLLLLFILCFPRRNRRSRASAAGGFTLESEKINSPPSSRTRTPISPFTAATTLTAGSQLRPKPSDPNLGQGQGSTTGLAMGERNNSPTTTRWARRSFLGVLGMGNNNREADRFSGSSFGGGRERSVYSAAESEAPGSIIGESVAGGSGAVAGAHRHLSEGSLSGYQPGMPRPVITGFHYDQFGAPPPSPTKPMIATRVPVPRKRRTSSSDGWSSSGRASEEHEETARITNVGAERQGELVEPRPYGSYRYQNARDAFSGASTSAAGAGPSNIESAERLNLAQQTSHEGVITGGSGSGGEEFYTGDDHTSGGAGGFSRSPSKASSGGVDSSSSGSGSASGGSVGANGSGSGLNVLGSGAAGASMRSGLATQAVAEGNSPVQASPAIEGKWW